MSGKFQPGLDHGCHVVSRAAFLVRSWMIEQAMRKASE